MAERRSARSRGRIRQELHSDGEDAVHNQLGAILSRLNALEGSALAVPRAGSAQPSEPCSESGARAILAPGACLGASTSAGSPGPTPTPAAVAVPAAAAATTGGVAAPDATERLIGALSALTRSIAYMMRNERLILRPGVDAFLRIFHRNMFVTANVSSWLFDGIDDPVLDIAQNITEIDIPYDKFGWFYDRNGSETFDGQFLMDTGANDFSQLGNIVKWRNSNRTLYRDQCGEVKGSTGELWAPELGQPEVTIFAPDICTYMTLHKQGPYSTEGIDGVMYAANDSVFDNGYKYGSMACYCDEVRDNECLRPGALNVSSCRLGAPAFVSMPHFYNADPYYPSKIQGLDPVPDHAFRMALELFTGVPLFVKAQLQINLLVRHITGISINNQLPDRDTLVPMFWFRQEVAITPEYASLARWALNIRFGLPYVFYSITVIGLLLLISGIVVLIRKLLRSPDEQPILQTQSQEDLSR